MIAETITWTLLKDKWPEPSDATLSLIVSTDGEDGPEFEVIDGCTCFEDDYDVDAVYPESSYTWFEDVDAVYPESSYTWFEDADGNDIEGVVHAWTYGPTGKAVIDMLSAHLRPQDKPRNNLIPFDSELS